MMTTTMNSSGVKYTQDILNRNIIDRDIWWSDHQKEHTPLESRKYFIRMINRWKHLLRVRGAVKGNLVTISLLSVDITHVSAIIACAELGLKIMLLDSPATEESLPYTKLALHGPSDFYLHHMEEGDNTYGGLHGEMMRRYGGKSIDASNLLEMSEEDLPCCQVEISPDDPLLMSSTSGTTKPSRPVYFSHREVMTIARRNVNIFKFDENSKVVHSRNLHHASAMLTSLIPSLMVANHHFTFPISHDTNLEVNGAEPKSWKRIRDEGFTHIMIPNRKSLKLFLDKFDKPFKKTLNINMCGFSMTQSFVDMAKKHNVCFDSHYGSIDTAIPLLVNSVDKKSVVKENCLGYAPDAFYRIKVIGKKVEVCCEMWDKPRYMEDELRYDMDTGEFFIRPRKETSGRYITELLKDFPEEIDLDLFFQDTKLNYEQLRGHIDEVTKRYDKS